jgi:hypothetical protein
MIKSPSAFFSLVPAAGAVAIAMASLGCVGPETPAVAANPPSARDSTPSGVELAQPPSPPAVAPAPPPPAPMPSGGPGPPPPPPQHGDAHAHMYRFDFVLTGADVNASFSLNLEEGRPGEVSMGKNIPLISTLTPAPGVVAPRQDVGMKVRAEFTSVGDDVVLHVNLELSGSDSGQLTTFRKITASSDLLAPTGKSTLVSSVDEDKKHLQLTVTPSRMR